MHIDRLAKTKIIVVAVKERVNYFLCCIFLPLFVCSMKKFSCFQLYMDTPFGTGVILQNNCINAFSGFYNFWSQKKPIGEGDKYNKCRSKSGRDSSKIFEKPS